MEEINEVEDNVEIDKGRNMNIDFFIAMKIDKNVNDVIGVSNAHK